MRTKGNSVFIIVVILLTVFSVSAEPLECAVLQREYGIRATLAGVTGEKRALWHRLALADDARQPASAETAQSAMESANAILQRISFGKVSLSWAITPVLQLPHTSTYYSTNLTALLYDAKLCATEAGFDYANFDRVVMAPPAIAGWTQGMAAIGGNWLYIGVPDGGLVVHELGHTFGLPHANAWNTSRPDPFTKTSPPFPSNISQIVGGFDFQTNSFVGRIGIMYPGNSIEYGDPFDIMATGATNGDFSVNFKTRLGWISDSVVRHVSTTGTHRIYSQSKEALNFARPLAISIDAPVVGRTPGLAARTYWIEIAPQPETGILLRWIDLNNSQATLIDATPGTPSKFNDAALSIGRAFDDPGLGLSITPTVAGEDNGVAWVDVAVEFNAGAKSVMNPPMLPEFPGQYQISGRVTDTAGQPLANCRVHSGRINRIVNDRSDFVSTETDANGRYTLWLEDTSQPYIVGASIYGFRAGPNGDEKVISIPASGIASDVNFVFEPLPRISISAPAQLIEGGSGAFTISRTGSTDEPLEVWWQTTGTADDFDYDGPYGVGAVTIPAGSPSTTVPINALTTAGISPEKTLTLHASAPATIARGNVTYSYPGWELRSVGDEQKWFQTDPPYATFADAAATIRLLDALDPSACQVALQTTPSGERALQIFAPLGKILHVQQSANLIQWETIATRVVDASLTTIPIPPQSDAAHFYRAEVIEP